MSEFFSALGVAIVLEGVLYAIFPNAAKNMALTILSLPEPMLRRAGAVAVAAGVALVWFVRG